MFFDKDKIDLTLQTSSNTFLPGDVVQGSLRVDVKKAVELTAIRLVIYGKEKAWKRVSRGKRSYTVNGEALHYEQTITFFGSTKASGRKGGATLQPGTFNYPFQIVLPPFIPPSFAFRTGNGGSTLYYKMKVYVDIPNGFDKEEKYIMRVMSCVPVGQLLQCRNQFLQLQSTVQTHGCDCCGCFCCAQDGEFLDVQTAVGNTIAVLPRTTSQKVPHGLPPPLTNDFNNNSNSVKPPPNPNMIRVRVSVTNKTKKEVKSINVSLFQFVTVSVRGHSVSTDRLIATSRFSPKQGELLPGGLLTFDADLIVQEDTALDDSKQFPMPTLRTPHCDSVCYVKVDFPGRSAEGNIVNTGTVQLVTAVDQSNRVPGVPAIYSNMSVMPELTWGQNHQQQQIQQ